MRPLIPAALAACLLVGPIVRVARAELSPDDVRNAMNFGTRYLKDKQEGGGKWSDPVILGRTFEGGVTALCTLALLSAGEDKDEEHVKKALASLRRLRSEQTYVVALQTMVLCRADPERDQDLIARNVEWLERTQITTSDKPDRIGGWAYPQVGDGDASNSQFAVLALYEAARVAEAGRIKLNIKYDTWKLAHKYWFGNQDANGGWPYYKGTQTTGSMTCAGIASLVIIDDVLHDNDARVVGDKIDCCARAPESDEKQINSGIDWLRRNFHVDCNPPAQRMGRETWHLYYLYALERVGRLTARRKIGNRDWYREGADQLIHAFGVDSLKPFWTSRGAGEENEVVATSLALLFLAKGRRPVLMAKVQYSPRDDDWNHCRYDVNNMTIYVEGRWKKELSWQSIELRLATVDDLLQVPVLYFAGGGSPLPENREEAETLARKLRDYIDRGGFIFADGNCCATAFDAGFRQLMKLVFPEAEYRLKMLDESHPIWTAEEKLKRPRRIEGIDYGCRTSVVFAPRFPEADPRPSLSCLWDLSRGSQRSKYAPAVQEQIQDGLAIGINVLAYATNREIKPKDLVPASFDNRAKADKVERGKLYIAKLEHPGGCDAAPRALANLMEEAADKLKIRVEQHPKLVGMTDPALFDYPVVFIHGRNAFRLTEKERKALQEYVTRGGLLFGDAICGSEPFAESFRQEMKAIFPKNRLEPIPANDPIFSTKYGGYDLSSVTRRDPQPAVAGKPPQSVPRKVPPELKGVRFGDRYGVVFSEFDLSCALEKHDSAECRGYSREDAARIGINVLLYGIQQ